MRTLRWGLIIAREWWRAKWRPAVTSLVVVSSVAFAILTLAEFSRSEQARRAAQAQRRIDAGVSVLDNCQGVEAVKAALHATIDANLKQLPHLAYYKARPDELAQAQKDARLSLARFAASNCYALPTVRAAGLKPPAPPRANP